MLDTYTDTDTPSMRHTYEIHLPVEDKLHWTFRLYDQDGSGEIDPDEMELIFTKFCKICESTEVVSSFIRLYELNITFNIFLN